MNGCRVLFMGFIDGLVILGSVGCETIPVEKEQFLDHPGFPGGVIVGPGAVVEPGSEEEQPSVAEDDPMGDRPLPDTLLIWAWHPNPCRYRTTVVFAVPTPGQVRLLIFDLKGRRIRTLVDRHLEGPGWHETDWDGRNDQGREVGSGVFICRLENRYEVRSGRLTVVR